MRKQVSPDNRRPIRLTRGVRVSVFAAALAVSSLTATASTALAHGSQDGTGLSFYGEQLPDQAVEVTTFTQHDGVTAVSGHETVTRDQWVRFAATLAKAGYDVKLGLPQPVTSGRAVQAPSSAASAYGDPGLSFYGQLLPGQTVEVTTFTQHDGVTDVRGNITLTHDQWVQFAATLTSARYPVEQGLPQPVSVGRAVRAPSAAPASGPSFYGEQLPNQSIEVTTFTQHDGVTDIGGSTTLTQAEWARFGSTLAAADYDVELGLPQPITSGKTVAPARPAATSAVHDPGVSFYGEQLPNQSIEVTAFTQHDGLTEIRGNQTMTHDQWVQFAATLAKADYDIKLGLPQPVTSGRAVQAPSTTTSAYTGPGPTFYGQVLPGQTIEVTTFTQHDGLTNIGGNTTLTQAEWLRFGSTLAAAGYDVEQGLPQPVFSGRAVQAPSTTTSAYTGPGPTFYGQVLPGQTIEVTTFTQHDGLTEIRGNQTMTHDQWVQFAATLVHAGYDVEQGLPQPVSIGK